MAKLVAIGDSLTQGFQSGAILKTDWSFPGIIARSMGLKIPDQFSVPQFKGSGIPLNLEAAFQLMQTHLGSEVDLGEWIIQFPSLFIQFMDRVEDFYERGEGSLPMNYDGVYHNLAVWGFQVADSFKLNSSYSQLIIDREEGWFKDDFLGLPSGAMYRTAQNVLNPKMQPEKMGWTQLDNLREIVAKDQGELDNLILWLGSNDCLRTVLALEVHDMNKEGLRPEDDHPEGRRKHNLTAPQVFQQDFQTLIQQIDDIIPSYTQVFIGTIGHVTIPPVTTGIPPFNGKYFEYYGRFYARENNFNPQLHKRITGKDAEEIDQRIDVFNQIIRELVKPKPNWHIVEIGAVLDQLAVKRNHCSLHPGKPLTDYYTQQGIETHPLLNLSPIPSILTLRLENGKRVSGGLFSLDGIHPTTIGYGIIAEVFLQQMKAVGAANADPNQINWDELIAQDTLLQNPPLLWEHIVEAAEQNSTLWDVIFNVLY